MEELLKFALTLSETHVINYAIDPITIGAIASGVGSLFGIGRGGRQHRRNIRAMKMQHQMDKQMFDYQNAYNTPAMQMQRLKDAGLNPNLMYSQGTTGNASSPPYTKPLPAYQETPVDTKVFLEGANLVAQNKNLNEETKGKKIDNYIKAGGSKEAIRKFILENEKLEKEKEKLGADINNIKADTSLKKKAKEEIAQKIENLKEYNEIQKIKKSLDKIKEGRAKKGIIPGDHMGNILEGLKIDLSTEEGINQFQMLFYGYFGAKLGMELLRTLPLPKNVWTKLFGKNNNSGYPVNDGGYTTNGTWPTNQ